MKGFQIQLLSFLTLEILWRNIGNANPIIGVGLNFGYSLGQYSLHQNSTNNHHDYSDEETIQPQQTAVSSLHGYNFNGGINPSITLPNIFRPRNFKLPNFQMNMPSIGLGTNPSRVNMGNDRRRRSFQPSLGPLLNPSLNLLNTGRNFNQLLTVNSLPNEKSIYKVTDTRQGNQTHRIKLTENRIQLNHDKTKKDENSRRKRSLIGNNPSQDFISPGIPLDQLKFFLDSLNPTKNKKQFNGDKNKNNENSRRKRSVIGSNPLQDTIPLDIPLVQLRNVLNNLMPPENKEGLKSDRTRNKEKYKNKNGENSRRKRSVIGSNPLQDFIPVDTPSVEVRNVLNYLLPTENKEQFKEDNTENYKNTRRKRSIIGNNPLTDVFSIKSNPIMKINDLSRRPLDVLKSGQIRTVSAKDESSYREPSRIVRSSVENNKVFVPDEDLDKILIYSDHHTPYSPPNYDDYYHYYDTDSSNGFDELCGWNKCSLNNVHPIFKNLVNKERGTTNKINSSGNHKIFPNYDTMLNERSEENNILSKINSQRNSSFREGNSNVKDIS